MLILVYKGTMMLFEKIGVLQTDAFFSVSDIEYPGIEDSHVDHPAQKKRNKTI